ncbi:hypothetical protein SCB49_03239 [unidentified eubacterium SCB49]|nr:hypothetical protein SCB49_03239 [unidentified eubacterium SCB49]
MIIKSESRKSIKIAFVVISAFIFFILWLVKDNSFYIFLTGIFGFISLLEYVAYGQTILELTATELKVQRKVMLNIISEDFTIELKNIQSSFYDKKTYDSWELYQRLAWELLFPGGQSHLVIHKLDGKKHKIIFNGNETELLNLQKELPKRIPNY